MMQTEPGVRRVPRPTPARSTRHAPAPKADAPASVGGPSCDALLQAAAGGDHRAFACLYQQTSARLFAAVRRSIWVRSEAEEVLQEVYLKIWNGAAAFDPRQASSITWMTRVARNHAIDHLRRDAQRRAHEFDVTGPVDDGDPSDTESHLVDDAPRPDEWLELQQDRQRFDRLVGSLGNMQRQVVLMAFRDGCTQADIAEQLDAPLGSVKSWMRRALQRLKVAIDTEAPVANH